MKSRNEYLLVLALIFGANPLFANCAGAVDYPGADGAFSSVVLDPEFLCLSPNIGGVNPGAARAPGGTFGGPLPTATPNHFCTPGGDGPRPSLYRLDVTAKIERHERTEGTLEEKVKSACKIVDPPKNGPGPCKDAFACTVYPAQLKFKEFSVLSKVTGSNPLQWFFSGGSIRFPGETGLLPAEKIYPIGPINDPATPDIDEGVTSLKITFHVFNNPLPPDHPGYAIVQRALNDTIWHEGIHACRMKQLVEEYEELANRPPVPGGNLTDPLNDAQKLLKNALDARQAAATESAEEFHNRLIPSIASPEPVPGFPTINCLVHDPVKQMEIGRASGGDCGIVYEE